MAERDAYVKKLKAMLEEWNAEIDKLDAKARKADAEAKIRYEEQVSQLRQKRKELQNMVTQMGEASDDAWEDLKEGLENAWKVFKGTLSKAKSEFERGYKEGRKDQS